MPLTYEEQQTAARMAEAAMSKPHTIDLQLQTADMRHFGELTKGGSEAILHAIGYLTAYAIHGNYSEVTIRRDRDDLLAYYTDGERRFTMGGIWRAEERKFTFHS